MFGAVPEAKKKPTLFNGLENLIAYWDESDQIETFAKELDLFEIQLVGVCGESQSQVNCTIFTLN